jgi:hypothetical protein
MTKKLTVIITLLFFHFGISQQIDLSEWKRDSIPVSLEKLSEANNSKKRWCFSKSNDSIIIVENKYKRVNGDTLPFPIDSIKYISGTKHIKSVFNGYLVGYNHGEFGGGLKYVSIFNDYDYNVELIDKKDEWKYSYIPKNVKDIFEFNNKVYVTRGLAHLIDGNGGLFEVIYKNGKWNYKFISKLPGTPDITFEENNSLYIITTQHILRYDKNGKMTMLLKSPFYWGYLYPTNSFIKNNDIYLAMRKGILIIRDFESKPKYEWYLKKIL